MDANTNKNDLVAAQDIPAALGLLTRLPIPVDHATATARGAAAAWAWPLAGLAVALLAGLAGWITLSLGLPPGIAALLVLATQVIVTGAMHEDGLADCADGLWGGWTIPRRLEIMKDSRTGAYGVIALILSLLLRWSALTTLIGLGSLWAPLIAVAMISRVPMVALMVMLPNARDTGLSRSVGRPSAQTLALAISVAMAGAFVAKGSAAFGLLLAVAVVTVFSATIAKAKIKGQTGDILGAGQQLAEITTLLTLVAISA
jgi:adenosylcobinamide-GDP ribazoletransferase